MRRCLCFSGPAPAIPHRKVVVDVTADLAETARQRYGFDEAAHDWRSVIARQHIDAIDIVTPNDSHAEIAVAAAQAGKHIICEKPLARTGDEAKTMLDAVEKAGVIHMVAFNYRRTPAVALAKKYIEEGRIGNILSFRGTYLQDLVCRSERAAVVALPEEGRRLGRCRRYRNPCD